MRAIRTSFAALGGAALVSSLASCAPGGGGFGNTALVNFVTATVPSGTTGVSYGITLDADFPHPPGIFKVTGGALPPGLDLDKFTGELTGYPRQTGVFHFEIGARDGLDEVQLGGVLPPGRDASFAEARQEFALDVALGPPNILPQQPPACQYRASYAYPIDAAGGTQPYTFQQVGGSLPAGLTISASGILGTFATQAQALPYSFDVRVTDANGLTDVDTLSVQVVVLPLILFTSNPIPEAAQGFPYDLTIALASGGGGAPFTWSQAPLVGGETDLNSIGMQISTTGHLVDFGTGPNTVGNFNFTVKVVDEAGQIATRPLTLKVNPGPVLTSISPNRASSPPPYTVTGLNFQPGAQIIFKPGATQTAVTPTFVNATTLTITGAAPKPSDGSGAVDARVRNPDGGFHTKAAAFVFPATTIAFATKGFLSSNLSSTGLDCADVNGDGKADVVHCGASGMTVYGGSASSTNAGLILHVNLGGSPPTFSSATLDTVNFYDVKFADLNSDGKLDIVALGQASVKTWINNPLGTFTAGPVSALPSGYGSWPSQMAVGNLNNDAIPDVAFGVPLIAGSGVYGRYFSMIGNGAGGFTTLDQVTTTMPVTYGVTSLLLIDTNGDGRAEVAAGIGMNSYSGPVFNYSDVTTSGNVVSWNNRGGSITAPAYGQMTGCCAGDFLGNGVPAIITAFCGAPNYSNVQMLTLWSGSTLSTQTNLLAPGAQTKSLGSIDADFDAKIDWAMSTQTSIVRIYKGQGQTQVLALDASVGTPAISSPRTGRIASGDLDGDGRPDILATTSYWACETMGTNYGTTYILSTAGNGGSLGVVFFLNTSN